jgi:hypothetical protein
LFLKYPEYFRPSRKIVLNVNALTNFLTPPRGEKILGASMVPVPFSDTFLSFKGSCGFLWFK